MIDTWEGFSSCRAWGGDTNSLTLKFVASKEGVTQDIASIVFVTFFGMCVHPVFRTAPVNYANIVPSPLNVSLDRNIEDYSPDNDDYKIVIINEAVTNVTIIKQLRLKKARDAARPRPKMSH